MSITLDKKYTTRNGREVRVYAIYEQRDFPIHGAIYVGNGEWYQESWNSDGKRVEHEDDAFDLIELWVPQDKEPVWSWDEGDTAKRELRFWDSKNNCVFICDGGRNGLEYDNYSKVEYIERWMIDCQLKLKD